MDIKKKNNLKENKKDKKKRKLFDLQLSDNSKKKLKKTVQIILVSLLFLIIIVTASVFITLKKVKMLQKNFSGFFEQLRNEQFVNAKTQLDLVKGDIVNIKASYDIFTFVNKLPIFGNYYKDGSALLSASENFINSLGIVTETLITEKSKLAEMSEDSEQKPDGILGELNIFLRYSPSIASSAGKIRDEMVIARAKLEEIQPSDYPEQLLGKNVRLHIDDFLKAIDNGILVLNKGQDLISIIPSISGFNDKRKYLILFQNNKELRPTGGFMTAYTIAEFQSGNFFTEDSSDIYDLDERYEPEIPAPEPIIENLQGPYIENGNLKLRDMNWNPDFPTSMELFLRELEKVGINDMDGVIALDTQVLVDIIDVIGEINVPGYGGYSNNIVELCDCEQIIYELEHFADREGPIVWSENEPGKIVHAPENYDDRKKIIGPMMNTIVGNILNLRKTKYPALFNAIMGDLREKHILLYMIDDHEQKALGKMNISGEMVEAEDDYIYVNDANLGGKKANLYVTHQVDQIVEVAENGSIVKTVKLTYTNPKPQNNWLNTVLPNYLRIYVPYGSEIIEYKGFDYFDEPYEELGKTVFAGLLTVRPKGITIVTIKYSLPFAVKSGYNLYLQKQPGKISPVYSVSFDKHTKEFYLDTDKVITIDL
ncbi:DUF4012 domain-containing protein [Candidatus Woesebacteria bacterium]|nr:DUF4012 domain-containing protein [Candidatus Woesebacteria bacterium]